MTQVGMNALRKIHRGGGGPRPPPPLCRPARGRPPSQSVHFDYFLISFWFFPSRHFHLFFFDFSLISYYFWCFFFYEKRWKHQAAWLASLNASVGGTLRYFSSSFNMVYHVITWFTEYKLTKYNVQVIILINIQRSVHEYTQYFQCSLEQNLIF